MWVRFQLQMTLPHRPVRRRLRAVVNSPTLLVLLASGEQTLKALSRDKARMTLFPNVVSRLLTQRLDKKWTYIIRLSMLSQHWLPSIPSIPSSCTSEPQTMHRSKCMWVNVVKRVILAAWVRVRHAPRHFACGQRHKGASLLLRLWLHLM